MGLIVYVKVHHKAHTKILNFVKFRCIILFETLSRLEGLFLSYRFFNACVLVIKFAGLRFLMKIIYSFIDIWTKSTHLFNSQNMITSIQTTNFSIRKPTKVYIDSWVHFRTFKRLLFRFRVFECVLIQMIVFSCVWRSVCAF